MDVARGQAALARLMADGALRRRFLADPAAAAAELSLAPADAAALAATAGEGIRRFAVSLERKRRGGVAFHLPLSRRALGATWVPVFARYVDAVAGAATYRDDAARFARWLASLPPHDDVPAWLADLAAFEVARGVFVDPRRRLSLRRFRYPVAKIAREVDAGAVPDGVSPRTTLVAWVRWRAGGPVRTWCRPG
jgi:hypothetical protein